LGFNELSGAKLRTEAGRKQPNVRRHADAITPRKWPYTQDVTLLRELRLDNDHRLFSAILQSLNCAAWKGHWGWSGTTLYIEDGRAGRNISLGRWAADHARCGMPIGCRNGTPKLSHSCTGTQLPSRRTRGSGHAR